MRVAWDTDAVRKDSRHGRGPRRRVRTYITRLNEIAVEILEEFTPTEGARLCRALNSVGGV